MNTMSTLPSGRDRRDFALAELRVERTAGAIASIAENIDLVAAATGALMGLRFGARFGLIGAAAGSIGGTLAGFKMEAEQ